jgi:GST-like protein
MMGETYTLVDMSVWGWARVIPFVLGADAWEKLPHVKRLLDEINLRPAAQRAEALKTRFKFKTEVDADARKVLFPSNERLNQAGGQHACVVLLDDTQRPQTDHVFRGVRPRICDETR